MNGKRGRILKENIQGLQNEDPGIDRIQGATGIIMAGILIMIDMMTATGTTVATDMTTTETETTKTQETETTTSAATNVTVAVTETEETTTATTTAKKSTRPETETTTDDSTETMFLKNEEKRRFLQIVKTMITLTTHKKMKDITRDKKRTTKRIYQSKLATTNLKMLLTCNNHQLVT